jgi:DNA-binding beta-propeller fold protein YncE
MAVYSPDSKTIYVPIPNVNTGNAKPGGVHVISTANGTITGTLPIPGARYVSISPDGKTLLVFASNSDTMYMVNLTASTLSGVAITGFAAPVNAFFSTDSTTAYVLNCGPECGSTAARRP